MFYPTSFQSSFSQKEFKFYKSYTRPYTVPLIERTINNISYNLRCKENWAEKYKDAEISAKWKNEIRQQLQEAHSTNIDDIINYVFAELAYFESIEAKSDYHAGFNDHVFFADNVIPQSIKESFLTNSLHLETSEPIDYHPKSNKQVIDLVHPSLFPLVYDRSIDDKTGIVLKPLLRNSHDSSYQWLPSVFKLDEFNKYKIVSYINNLHPIKYKSLYGDIEDIFNAILPGLQLTLSRSLGEEKQKINMPYASKLDVYDYYLTQKILELREKEEDDEDSDYYDQIEDMEKDEGANHLKPLESFTYPGAPETVNLNIQESFPELKVIVKMANIVLTPESPEYPGGSWHVEGCDQERIIATVIYYYESENIDDSRLQFCEPMAELIDNYEQNETWAVFHLYGLEAEDTLMIDQGDVVTQQDRVVVFPNFLHHKVNPFKLKDSTKAGTRKILCFFLIDPFEKQGKVLSTRDIPPQQKSWWDEEDENVISTATKKRVLGFVEDEKKSVPFTLEEAKLIREKLMEERVSANKTMLENNYQFSLCEH